MILVALLATSAALQAQEPQIIRMANKVQGEYIVLFRDKNPANVGIHASTLALASQGRVLRTFSRAAQGAGIEMTEAAAAALLHNPMVESIQENAIGDYSHSCWPDPHSFELQCFASSGDASAEWLWHLDRLDQRGKFGTTLHPTYGTPTHAYGWTYDGSGASIGSSVDIYVIDSGVKATHQEFASGQVLTGNNFIGSDPANSPCASEPFLTGHGTSVASIAAGSTVGVAKSATIIPVKVSDCAATGPDLLATIAALSWTHDQYFQRSRPAVVNMSFYFKHDGGSYAGDDVYTCVGREGQPNVSCLTALEQSIAQMWRDGLVMVTSANNQLDHFTTIGGDDCVLQTPQRMGHNGQDAWSTGGVITVGGTNINDQRYVCSTCGNHDKGSNTGPCVSLYAPAHQLRSAHISGTAAYRNSSPPPALLTTEAVTSGTSFASPIVAGAAARWLSQYPWLHSDDVYYWIYITATSLPNNFDGDSVSNNDRLVHVDVDH